MNVLETLIAGRAIIADPKNWTTRVSARDANGTSVLPSHPSACKFCSLGALTLVEFKNDSYFSNVTMQAEDALRQAMGCQNVAIFNDDQTHEAVIAAWDRAIAQVAAGRPEADTPAGGSAGVIPAAE